MKVLNLMYTIWSMFEFGEARLLLLRRLSCSYSTILLPRSCQQYFLFFFVRRSEIVFYVLVKETDQKKEKSIFLRRKGREAAEKKKRSICRHLFYIPLTHLFYIACFETTVASLKASVWDSLWHLSFECKCVVLPIFKPTTDVENASSCVLSLKIHRTTVTEKDRVELRSWIFQV